MRRFALFGVALCLLALATVVAPFPASVSYADADAGADGVAVLDEVLADVRADVARGARHLRAEQRQRLSERGAAGAAALSGGWLSLGGSALLTEPQRGAAGAAALSGSLQEPWKSDGAKCSGVARAEGSAPRRGRRRR